MFFWFSFKVSFPPKSQLSHMFYAILLEYYAPLDWPYKEMSSSRVFFFIHPDVVTPAASRFHFYRNQPVNDQKTWRTPHAWVIGNRFPNNSHWLCFLVSTALSLVAMESLRKICLVIPVRYDVTLPYRSFLSNLYQLVLPTGMIKSMGNQLFKKNEALIKKLSINLRHFIAQWEMQLGIKSRQHPRV